MGRGSGCIRTAAFATGAAPQYNRRALFWPASSIGPSQIEGEPSVADEFYFNPFDPAFRANPYPFYKPLYVGPPRLVDFYGPTLLVARHADVAAVWSDAERFSSAQPPGARPRSRHIATGRVADRQMKGVHRWWCWSIVIDGADLRFAVPRCWSGGDSNCRSHPTRSLVACNA